MVNFPVDHIEGAVDWVVRLGVRFENHDEGDPEIDARGYGSRCRL